MSVRHLALPGDGGFMLGGGWRAYCSYDAPEESSIVVEDDTMTCVHVRFCAASAPRVSTRE